jgi:hypothetical protein
MAYMRADTMPVDDSDDAVAFPPRCGSIPRAIQRYGISRSLIYRMAKTNPKLLRRWFGRTVVDYAEMDCLVDALPTVAQNKLRRATNLKSSEPAAS